MKSLSTNPLLWILANTWAMINTQRKRMSPHRFCTGHHQSLLNASASEGTRRRRARRSVVLPQLSGPTTNNACRFNWEKFCWLHHLECIQPVVNGINIDKSWINYQTQKRVKKRPFLFIKEMLWWNYKTTTHEPNSMPWIFDFFFCTLPASNLNEHSEMAGDKFVEYLLQQGMNPHPSWLVVCQSVRQKGTSDLKKEPNLPISLP